MTNIHHLSSALLDPTSHKAHILTQTQILTSISPFPPNTTNTTNTTPQQQAHPNQQIDLEEPLPHIDYHLLHQLIRLVTPQLDKRGKKRYDYLIQARRWYYAGHEKFHEAYRNLQDAYAYGIILTQRHDTLTKKEQQQNLTTTPTPTPIPIPTTSETTNPTNNTVEVSLQTQHSELPHLTHLRRINNETLRHLVTEVRARARARDAATNVLSSAKWDFLQMEIPPLVGFARDLFAAKGGGESGEGERGAE